MSWLFAVLVACDGTTRAEPPSRHTAAPHEAPIPAASDPPAPAWTEAFRLDHPSHDVGGEPNVVVHAPVGWSPTPPFDLVVFLHGWDCCAVSIAGDRECGPDDPVQGGWHVARFHDAAGAPTLLVVPQLSHLERSSDPGHFSRPGFFRAWLDELFGRALARRIGAGRTSADVRSIVLVAHSAGGQTLLAILRAGDLANRIRAAVFLDALYTGSEEVAAWALAAPGREVVTVHTGATSRASAALADRLSARLDVARNPPDLESAVSVHRVVVARTAHAHGDLPRAHLAPILAGIFESRSTSPR